MAFILSRSISKSRWKEHQTCCWMSFKSETLDFQRNNPNHYGGQHVLSKQGAPGLITAFFCYSVLCLLTRNSMW